MTGSLFDEEPIMDVGWESNVAREARERRESLAQGRALAADGIARADVHADPDWRIRARAALSDLARRQEQVTSDDLWTVVEKPAEARASGAVFQWAARAGIIVATDRFIPTTQATSHASPMRVWRSLVHEG